MAGWETNWRKTFSAPVAEAGNITKTGNNVVSKGMNYDC
jgi:hypothetical protein